MYACTSQNKMSYTCTYLSTFGYRIKKKLHDKKSRDILSSGLLIETVHLIKNKVPKHVPFKHFSLYFTHGVRK